MFCSNLFAGVVASLCFVGDKPSVPARFENEATIAAQAFWKEWAAKHDYRFLTTKDERVVLMVAGNRSKPERVLDLVERSLARVDELLPPVPAVDVPPPADPPAAPAVWTWGTPDHPLDSDAIVVGLFRDPKDYASALETVAAAFPYLATWVKKGKYDPGCILVRPLFAACVDNVPGMEEWNPDNEVVHRTAQAAMWRRFGEQPIWVGLGVGWNVEFDVLKSIYCFPWRNGFVSVKEHGAWEADLRRDFSKREKQPLTMDELAAIRRGSFDSDQAALSWGTIRFLGQHHAAELPKLLVALHQLREKLGRVASEDGKSWTMAAEYELPAAEQKSAIERQVAPTAFEQASDWFRLGKKWKPAK